MPESTKPKEGRYIKGILLVDYVKMIRGNPDQPWSDYLSAEDLEQVSQLILPASWYPLEFFQRVGAAVFKIIAKENYEVLRVFGRTMADKIHDENPGMVSHGRARDTLRKYRAVNERVYSFQPVETDDIGPGHLVFHTFSTPDEYGAKMIMEIVAGSIERLIALSGGRNINIRLIEAVWEGADQNSIEVTWEE